MEAHSIRVTLDIHEANIEKSILYTVTYYILPVGSKSCKETSWDELTLRSKFCFLSADVSLLRMLVCLKKTLCINILALHGLYTKIRHAKALIVWDRYTYQEQCHANTAIE